MKSLTFCFWIALLVLQVSCAKSKYNVYSSVNTTIDSAYNSSDLEKTIAPYREQVNREMNEIIGVNDSTLVKFTPESPLGNFAADILFKRGIELPLPPGFGKMNPTNTFALLNFGGLRSSLSQGDVTIGNVYELMPFDNTITVVKIQQPGITELMSYLYEMDGQPVANAQFTLSADERKMKLNNAETDPEADFFVITSDYLASGGDKMNFLKNASQKWDSGVLIREAIISYIRSKKRIEFTPVSGRMQILK